jgi:phosphotransferase system enzyme I (PtsI)
MNEVIDMKFDGVGISPGISNSMIYKFEKAVFQTDGKLVADVTVEINRFRAALDESLVEIEKIRNNIVKAHHPSEGAIFDAHIEILKDPVIIEQTEEIINVEKLNAARAYETVMNKYISMFDEMDDSYMRERATDLKDIKERAIGHLLGRKEYMNIPFNGEAIIVAHDLTPSDTAQLDRNLVKGIVTEIGGRTSHSAIIARSLGIPYVVVSGNFMYYCKTGDEAILNGDEGSVILNPSDEDLDEYFIKKKEFAERRKLLESLKDSESETRDGFKVKISGNIGSIDDLDSVLENGGEGIGLFRTEFLFMNRKSCPDEDEQFETYREVLEKMDGRPVVIRTLDVGGDKKIDYIDIGEEMNPFLGNRAIRLCLDEEDMFKCQVRALLRASIHGNLKIMFPMIATIDEFRKAKAVFSQCRDSLVSEGCKINEDIEVGMMVEIPSAAILAHKFAKEADFFSIGTNDLIQYTFAADRMNEKVSYLYQPLNPSLLILIKNIIDAAKKEGIHVGMCGEMASNKYAVPLLIGLGLDELSMSSSRILETREIIGRLNQKEMKKLVEKALEMSTCDEVVELVAKNNIEQ